MNGTTLRTELALWMALLAGFSPAIAEFAKTFADTSWSSTVLLAPILIACCAWRGGIAAEPPRRSGALLIAAGLLLELIGIALGTWTIEWVGFPVAAVGLARFLGRPSWRVAALAFGLVAIPESIEGAYTPVAESALLSGACAAWRFAGLAIECSGPVARIGDRHLLLVPADAGWPLAAALAELGWFLAVIRGATFPRALLTALGLASAVVFAQPLAIGLAVGILAIGSASAARAWLSHGVWLACTAAALFGSARARRSESGT